MCTSRNESESEVAQLCLNLCNPMVCSLPDFSVHGIFQARVLKWVAFSFSSQFSSVAQLCPTFATLRTAALQASLSITNSWSLPKLMFIESVMPSNHLILCCPLLLSPSILPSIRVFSNECSLQQVAKVFEPQLQHQSFQITFRTDLL